MQKNSRNHSIIYFLLIGSAILTLCPTIAKGQLVNPGQHDTSYYETFPEHMVARTYFSRKYTTFALRADNSRPKFRYIPNSTLNFGVGLTYKSLSLNLGYGFNFLNDKDRVKTKYLDLQAHLYGRKWLIDLFGEFYKGYFLKPKGMAAPPGKDYYTRPDLGVTLLGASLYRILNYDRFSFRPGFPQDEWQKKSAGSLLVGAEVYYGITSADSSFVPSEMADQYNQLGIRRVTFFEIGPGIGYAYTLVVAKHFFATASLVGNISVSYAQEEGLVAKRNAVNVTPNYSGRVSIGYSSRKYNINMSIVEKGLNIKAVSSSERYIIRTGNYRLTYGWRFMPGPKVKKKLSFLDNL